MKSLGDYIPRLKQLPNNFQFGALEGTRVLVLEPVEDTLVSSLTSAGIASITTLGPDRINAFIRDESGSDIQAELSAGKFDRIFFDVRYWKDGSDPDLLRRLFDKLRKALSGDGAVFCILRIGVPDHGFDVLNSVVQTETGVLATQGYLFEEILERWSVRMMDGSIATAFSEAARFVRLSPKRPTLLMILGRSQAGKTSLAREMVRLDRHMHVSNDYIYTELVRKARAGLSADIPERLLNRLGDGSGTACGNFNRALEADADLLDDYLEVVLKLLPVNKQIVSMDFDMMRPDQVSKMKMFFDRSGYSVWTVQR